MAQLKDLIVTGASRLIGDVYTSQIQISQLNALTDASATTYGAGSAGQVLMSNGTDTYWGTPAAGVTESTVSGWGFTKNAGTVTSVQVQATAPVVSSSSASATGSLNTTISLAKTTANYVIAGPTSGTTTAVPTYRKLVAADIPITVSNTWTNGTSSGPTLKTTVNNTTGTAVAIPIATTAQSGVVTTTAQKFTGIKSFPHTSNIYTTSESTSPRLYFKQADDINVGSVGVTTSKTNNIQRPHAVEFQQYSYNSSSGEISTTSWEMYRLPEVTAGMSTTKVYTILTTKSPVTIAQGGTSATNAAGARTNLELGNAKIFYGTCSTAAGTVAKTVTCAEFTSADLVKGAIIYVTFDNTNSGAIGSLTMSVNGTTAKPIKHLRNGAATNNIPSAGYLLANQTYLFTYDGTNWVTDMEYDSNDTTRMNIRYNGGTFVPSTALYRYQILFSKNETTLIPANTTSNSTATTKTLTTESFNPFLPIYYYGYTSTVNANAAISASYLWCANENVDLRYAFNTGTTLTNNKDVYIVAQMDSSTTCKLVTTVAPITQALPSTEDGYIYIKLGHARSTSNIALTYDHPIFWYKNGALRSYGDWGIELNRYYGSLETDGWKNLGGRTSGQRLTISYNNAAATWNTGTYSASLLFGCNDTKGLLDIAHASPVVSFAGGSVSGTTDNDPKWYYKLSGTNGCTYTLPTATKTLAANDGSNATGTWTLNLKTNKIQAPTTAGGSTYGTGSSGQALLSNGSTVYWGSVSGTDEKVKYDKSTSNTAFKVLAGANASPTNGTCTSSTIYCDNITLNPSNGVFRATKVYGAVFNDYAEYREIKDDILPGNCVIENGDGTLKLTTERLMRGCEIISDTYGFAIGQTKQCQTPVAVSGRVLAYCLEGKEIAKNYIGWPVCSGPNGTVSIMTEEEEIKYPSRIIGTISEIPDYEIWGSNNIEVNNRIWIRIR